MVNLLNVLTEKDKENITSYIDTFALSKEHFEGVDDWLADWNKNKQTLFHLLGDKLIVKVPYTWEIPLSTLKKEIRDFYFDTEYEKTGFISLFRRDVVRNKSELLEISDGKKNLYQVLDNLSYRAYIFSDGVITDYFPKIKIGDQPTLQIPNGSKTMRSIQKILNYFSFFGQDTKDAFEDFRIKISQIENQKKLKGYLCLSIHPLDYMTMSDNAENWWSCMNWTHDAPEGGCYHAGTVEMMNSNIALCCYLESENKKFSWGNSEEEYSWNSKKWRILVYANKDIIVSGKSYPYYNEDLSKEVVEKVKELAGKNLNWNYKYGIEPYLDMKNVDCLKKMQNIRYWMRSNYTKKKNIIFDTNGMYNDMLNDNRYRSYFCYRNKVKKNTIINQSGPCPCLKCHSQVIRYIDDDYNEDYNERFENVGCLICDDCFEEIKCRGCETLPIKGEHFFKYEGDFYCSKCLEKYFKECKKCGEKTRLTCDTDEENHLYFIEPSLDAKNLQPNHQEQTRMTPYQRTPRFERFCVCKDCASKLLKTYSFEKRKFTWTSSYFWVLSESDPLILEELKKYHSYDDNNNNIFLKNKNMIEF